MTSVTFKQGTVVKAPAYLKVKELSSPSGFVRVAHTLFALKSLMLCCCPQSKNTRADIYGEKSKSSTFSKLFHLQMDFLLNLLVTSHQKMRVSDEIFKTFVSFEIVFLSAKTIMSSSHCF